MTELIDATEAAALGITSRRAVLRGAAAPGAVGVAAAALAGAAFPAANASASTAKPAGQRREADHNELAATSEPIVLHVRDADAGEIDVFRGTSVTRLHEIALARQIVRAAG